MSSQPQHGVVRIIAGKMGLLSLLFVVWWTIQICQLLAPSQNGNQSDVAFAIALVLFFGTIAGIPVIGYLVCADLIAKQWARPWNMIVFLGLVIVGLGLYIVALQLKTQAPVHSAYDVWRTYSSGFVPILGVAAVLFLNRYGRYFEPPGK